MAKGNGPRREQLGNEIAALMSRMTRSYRSGFVACADQLELGPGEAQALWLLGAGGEASTGELARRLRVDPANASTLVSKLERRALIRREPAPQDRRKRIVSLTTKGRGDDSRPQSLHGATTGWLRRIDHERARDLSRPAPPGRGRELRRPARAG